MAEKCGCTIRTQDENHYRDGLAFTIVYCPMHKAAPAMLAALEHQRLLESGVEPPPFGHDCLWCGECTERVAEMRLEAIAQAGSQEAGT